MKTSPTRPWAWTRGNAACGFRKWSPRRWHAAGLPIGWATTMLASLGQREISTGLRRASRQSDAGDFPETASIRGGMVRTGSAMRSINRGPWPADGDGLRIPFPKWRRILHSRAWPSESPADRGNWGVLRLLRNAPAGPPPALDFAGDRIHYRNHGDSQFGSTQVSGRRFGPGQF